MTARRYYRSRPIRFKDCAPVPRAAAAEPPELTLATVLPAAPFAQTSASSSTPFSSDPGRLKTLQLASYPSKQPFRKLGRLSLPLSRAAKKKGRIRQPA